MNTNEEMLRFEYEKGEQKVFPAHWMNNSWLFKEDEKDEASLAFFIAKVAEKNGMSANDIHHMFPYILRMLKSDIDWSK